MYKRTPFGQRAENIQYMFKRIRFRQRGVDMIIPFQATASGHTAYIGHTQTSSGLASHFVRASNFRSGRHKFESPVRRKQWKTAWGQIIICWFFFV
jgi:hypothetical protein